MKTTNILKKIKYSLLAVAFCLIAAIAFIVPSFASVKSVKAASPSVTFTSYTSASEIKTNATNTEFIVYGVVSNNTTELFGGEFAINIDTSVFEFKGYISPSQIATALNKPELANNLDAYQDVPNSNLANGKAVCAANNKGDELTANTFCIGGFKVAVKEGVTLTGSTSSAITISDVLIPTFDGEEPVYNLVSTNLTVAFTEPSTACDITNLTYSGITINKDGANFKAEVPYSVKTLNTANLKASVSAGAIATYSPSGASVALTENGTTEITITVTAEDGKTQKTAKLSITRAAGETVNTLSALSLKNGSTELLSKSASDLTSGGEFTVDGEIANADKDKLTVSTAKNGTYSTVEIKVDGTSKYTGKNTETTKDLALSGLTAGDHTVVVTVKAETGASTAYTVKFKVAEASTTPVDPTDPTDPTNPTTPTNPGSTNVPDENGGIFKPTLTNINPVFTGKELDITTLLDGFNKDYMELSGDTNVTKAGKYSVTVTLKNTEDNFWKDKTKSASIGARAGEGSITLDYEILPYNIPASSWSVKAGEAPVLQGLAESYLSCLDFAYATEDGTAVDPENLEYGVKYTVTATVKDEFNDSLYFTDAEGELGQSSSYEFTYEKPAHWYDFFMKEFLGLKVWMWIVIAVAAVLLLLALVIIVAVAIRNSKKKSDKLAQERKEKAEKREEEKRRMEHEERLAKAQQPQQIAQPQMQTQFIPQFIPQPVQQSQPQTQTQFVPQFIPQPQASSNNGVEMAMLMSEMSALKAEQASSKEIAALRAEISALRAERNNSAQETAAAQPQPAQQAQPQQQAPQYMPQPQASSGSGVEMAMLMSEMSALRAEQATSKEIAALRAEQNSTQEMAALRAEISALRAEQASAKEIAALKAELNSKELGSMHNDMSYAKRAADVAAMPSAPAVSSSVPTMRVSANELTEIITTAVESAMAGIAQRESYRAAEANKAQTAKQQTAQPVIPVYPPDAVMTTVTTTKVDTTKKGADKADKARGNLRRQNDTDGMIYDIGGFYDSADE